MSELAWSEGLAGRFRITRVLGTGGMGQVYLAEDAALGRTVALKVALRDMQDEGLLKRFRREARNLSLLDHPNIVRHLDTVEHEDTTVLVMEYVEGRTVEEVVVSSAKPVCAAVEIMAQVCDALAAAHAGGIVHRDLKPANILVTAHGQAKILDFGLARRSTDATRLTQTGTALGTPGYMAPEQIRGTRTDGRADLYAVGVILHRLCTGGVPFEGDDPMTLLFKHLSEPPTRPRDLAPDLPERLDVLILSLLAKNPEDRPESAASVGETLRAIRAGLDRPAILSHETTPEAARQPATEALAAPPLVGREREMAALREALEETIRGRSAAAVLRGESGAGKTRLARELKIYAVSAGAGFLKGAGVGETRPLAPLEQIWEQMRMSAPRLFRDAIPARQSIEEEVEPMLRALTEHAPQVLFIDDADNVNETVWEVLERAIRNLVGHPPLVLAAFQDEPPAPARRTLIALEAHEIHLGPLSAVSLGALAMHRLGAPMAAHSLSDLSRRCGGNPLVAVELLNFLQNGQRLTQEEDGWTLAPQWDRELPDSLPALLLRRAQGLGDDALKVLSSAACLGSRFNESELAHITGFREDELRKLLREVGQQGLVQEEWLSQEDRWSLCCSAFRSFLKDRLPARRRRRLLDAAATWSNG